MSETHNGDASETGTGTAGPSAAEASGGDPSLQRVLRAHGLVAFLAALVFWAPFLFTGSGLILVTGPLLGGAIVLLAAYNAYRASVGQSLLLPVSALLVLLSAVAAASPFLLGVESEIVLGVTAAAGALAALVAIYAVVGGWRLRDRTSPTGGDAESAPAGR